MSEGDIGTILRALGKVEGKVDSLHEAVTEMARKNDTRDAALGDHERRIGSLEDWRTEENKTEERRRSTWRDYIGWLIGGAGAGATIVWVVQQTLAHH